MKTPGEKSGSKRDMPLKRNVLAANVCDKVMLQTFPYANQSGRNYNHVVSVSPLKPEVEIADECIETAT